jgi:flagellar biogenesis protein FliO
VLFLPAGACKSVEERQMNDSVRTGVRRQSGAGPGRQRGWTIWSLSFVFLFIAFSAWLTMKLSPPYFDNQRLVEGLKKLSVKPGFGTMERTQLIRELDNILYLDYAHTVVDLNKALSVERTKTEKRVRVNYEVIVPLLYNVSALLEFQNEVSGPL